MTYKSKKLASKHVARKIAAATSGLVLAGSSLPVGAFFAAAPQVALAAAQAEDYFKDDTAATYTLAVNGGSANAIMTTVTDYFAVATDNLSVTSSKDVTFDVTSALPAAGYDLSQETVKVGSHATAWTEGTDYTLEITQAEGAVSAATLTIKKEAFAKYSAIAGAVTDSGANAVFALTLDFTPALTAEETLASATLGKSTATGTKFKFGKNTITVTATKPASDALATAAVEDGKLKVTAEKGYSVSDGTTTGKAVEFLSTDTTKTLTLDAALTDASGDPVSGTSNSTEAYYDGRHIVVKDGKISAVSSTTLTFAATDATNYPDAYLDDATAKLADSRQDISTLDAGDHTVTFKGDATKNVQIKLLADLKDTSTEVVELAPAEDGTLSPDGGKTTKGVVTVPSRFFVAGKKLLGFAKQSGLDALPTASSTVVEGKQFFAVSADKTITVKVGADSGEYYAVYADGYTIAFDKDGGSGEAKSIERKIGDSATIDNPGLTKTGWVQTGWVLTAASGDNKGTYYIKGTDAIDPSGVRLYKEADYTDAATGLDLDDLGEDNDTITLKAVWARQYKVVFAKGGVECTLPEDVANVSAATTGSIPAATGLPAGYTFAGWSTEAGGKGTVVKTYAELAAAVKAKDSLVSKRGEVTLYVWAESSAASGTITYKTGAPAGVTLVATVSDTSVTPSNFGYIAADPVAANGYADTCFVRFAGWKATDGTVYTEGAATPSDLAKTAMASASDVTLTAVWEPVYKVVYKTVQDTGAKKTASDTSGDHGFAKDAKVSTTLDTTASDTTRTKFAGWSLSQSGAAKYQKGDAISEEDLKANADDENIVTLYAVYADKDSSYVVKFLKGDDAATGTMTDLNLKTGGSDKLTANKYELANHKFKGWSVNGTTTVLEDGASQTALDALIKKNVTSVNLIALWNKEYTVEYDAGKAASENAEVEIDETEAVEGTSTALAKNAYTRKGYHFVGWSLSKNTVYDDDLTEFVSTTADIEKAIADKADQATGVTITAGDPVTVYAIWAVGDPEPEPEPEPVVEYGWYKDADGDYHYGAKDGSDDTFGWSRGGTKKYYYFFDLKTGKMVKNDWRKSGAYWYHFGPRGAMQHDQDIVWRTTTYWLNSRGAATKKA